MGKQNKHNNKQNYGETEERNNTNKLWDWVFFIGIALVLFLPLINFPPLFYADFGRTVIFRIITAILTFLFIFRVLFDRKYNPNIRITSESTNKNSVLTKLKNVLLSPLTYLIGLFLVFILATIFSANFSNSLFDTPLRSGGSLNYFLYIIFAILLFVTIRDEKKWKKLWIIALSVGILTALIAVEQKYQISHLNLIKPVTDQVPSTMGGPIFFGNYLLLLTFLPLSLFFFEKKWKIKTIYLLSFLLFVFVLIFCAEKRGPLAGLITGILFFVFFYSKRIKWVKITIVTMCILTLLGLIFLKNHPEISLFKNNKALNFLVRKAMAMSPLSPLQNLSDRASGWKISFEAIKEKPLLGWGPENFSIAFDKYYDPQLLGLKMDPNGLSGQHSSWWDKPHNFLLEYGVTTGITGLLVLLLLVGTLFWQLFLFRNTRIYADNKTDLHRYKMWAHWAQTTLIAYFVALFFSFDTVPTYIIFFLLIGFSFFLLRKTLIYTDNKTLINADTADLYVYDKTNTDLRGLNKARICAGFITNLRRHKTPIVVVLGIILVWFCWNWNLKPLLINKQINIALAQDQIKNYKNATDEVEKIINEHSFLDNYMRLKYLFVLANRIADPKEKTSEKEKLLEKALGVAKENAKTRQTYVRDWIYLGDFFNMVIENNFWPEKNSGFSEEANNAFKKAVELSPKRQETYLEWIKTDLITGEYEKAGEKADKCIALNPETEECFWMKNLTKIYLGNFKEIDEKYSKDYNSIGKERLLQLAKAFGDVKYYPPLVDIYKKIISLEPENVQYYASLAFVFKELGEYKLAKEQALEILNIAPQAKADVDKFINELPTDYR